MQKIFLLLITFPCLLTAQQPNWGTFENLVNKTWEAEGKWGNGSPFKQSIHYTYDLAEQLIIAKSKGFIDKAQKKIGDRNHGIRKYDLEAKKFVFWEFDVFGGVTHGDLILDNKNITYQYQYGNSVVTDRWEYVNDSTYTFTIGAFENGTWAQKYLETTLRQKKEETATQPDFRIRTITAGVTLKSLADTATIKEAITFLDQARTRYQEMGYVVQTIRISTQNLHQMVDGMPNQATIRLLKQIDKIATQNGLPIAVGHLLPANEYDANLALWVRQLYRETSNINFSLPIASTEKGIHEKSIKASAEICQVLSESKGGEANFRFTTSANCPANIPFFPAAFHEGVNSFAIGLELPNVLTQVFAQSNWETAKANLKERLERELKPIEAIANNLASNQWKYDGIDTSPAPGLDASIGEAIETLTKAPFGNTSTLAACALITDVIKNLDIKSCGYSGLMLPVIEDKVLAKRAIERRYTVKELLLFSAVSGTGLDVIPIPGNTPISTIENLYRDVAALSLKYNNKALSVRLFPIPNKAVGELVEFENPYLTTCVVMAIR